MICCAEQNGFRRNVERCGGAPVSVHFLKLLTVGLDVDHHRLKHSRDARRRQQDLTKQAQPLLSTLGSDDAHVPDHRTCGIEIGRDDE